MRNILKEIIVKAMEVNRVSQKFGRYLLEQAWKRTKDRLPGPITLRKRNKK